MLICNNVIQHYSPHMKNVLSLLGANNEIGEKTLTNHFQEINALTDKQIENFQFYKLVSTHFQIVTGEISWSS